LSIESQVERSVKRACCSFDGFVARFGSLPPEIAGGKTQVPDRGAAEGLPRTAHVRIVFDENIRAGRFGLDGRWVYIVAIKLDEKGVVRNISPSLVCKTKCCESIVLLQ
jgi:hypothetical protein